MVGGAENVYLTLPLLFLAMLLPLIPTVLLLVIGWRVMAAQEAMARALRQVAENLRR